jgi:hypothetical protein
MEVLVEWRRITRIQSDFAISRSYLLNGPGFDTLYTGHSTRSRRIVFMRAIDDGSVKYAAVLRLLQAWKRLPESDLSRMLRQYYLVTDDFREMEDQGLLTMSFIGDEYVIAVTTLGRLWLEQYSAEEKNSNAK